MRDLANLKITLMHFYPNYDNISESVRSFEIF